MANIFLLDIPMGVFPGLLILLLLVISSGLVSGSETAFFSLSPSDLEVLRNSKRAGDKLLLSFRSKPKALLATILIANNLINVGIVILATYLSAILFNFGDNRILAFVVEVVAITSVILIFGEIIPKILANKQALMMARLMAKPMNVSMYIFRPLSALLVKSTSLIDKSFAKKGHQISMSELSDAIEITSGESAPEEEKMILKGIATFGEKEASEIMQSRVNVTALDIHQPFSEVMQVVAESGFSRIPVYKENIDKVKGILYIKDLLPITHKQEDFNWNAIIRPAFYVPENKRLNDLLQEFREKKIHLAIVVDEYGGTSGIITLEDIIEEIVGEISDEFDKENQQFRYKKISSDSYRFEAKTPLNDLCKILQLDDDFFDGVKGESDSLGGLLLELEGKIPEKGATITFKQFEFSVTDVDTRKINEVKIKKVENENRKS
ncbi:MAG: gliding motility-associated protein GldE [Bacteroidales bacterium]|nr:gliding motility-associated protein GldE [Bacteroidales bacterium]MCF6342449.1 gliding motility-associated protein GldE [Bacteroidales bacterium]